MLDQKPRVLIVGGGPSGLIFALTLLKNDIPVRIIEKTSIPRIGQRGAGIMPRSLEMFTSLGIIDEVLEVAIPTPPVRKYEMPEGVKVASEFEMAPRIPPTPDCPFLNPVLLGQDRLEKIFHNALAKHGCQVEIGTELVGFTQSAKVVEVQLIRRGLEPDSEGIPEATQYDWVIGSDGARGIVRKLTGLPFIGETRQIENLVVGDIHVEGLSRSHWHLWGDVSSTLISLRPTENPTLFNFVIAGRDVNHAKLSVDKEAVRQCFQQNSGTKTNLQFKDVPWLSYYTPNIRMVQSMEHGRVFLVGDSAHVHSPTGGQGMNCGVQDSFNLAWKLALVMKGVASPALLHTYTEERLPVIKEMLQRTTSLLNRTFSSGTPQALSKSDGFLQLGVNCRWSTIVFDERKLAEENEDDEFADYDFGDAVPLDEEVDSYGIQTSMTLRAGDRAPDAPGLKQASGGKSSYHRLFQVFSASCHTVLIFTPSIRHWATISRVLEKLPKGVARSVLISQLPLKFAGELRGADLILEDTERHAHEAYGVGEEWGVAIIRPDGVVGAIARGAQGLQHYFSKLLHPPSKSRR